MIYKSTRQFNDFFDITEFRKYKKFRTDQNTRIVFDWLQERLDWLINSITNKQQPALQGVIVDLEEKVLKGKFGWTKVNKDDHKFFRTMIGAMVRFLVSEHGFSVKETGIPLRDNEIISTSATYQYDGPNFKDPF